MNTKMLIATAALAATAVMAAAPAAKADPQFGFTIGFNDFGGGFDHARDPFWEHRHHPHFDHGYGFVNEPQYGFLPPPPPPVVVNYGIGCGAGANVVAHAGFNRVRAVNCAGPVYTYEAWQRGQLFDINVNNRGRITQVVQAY